ncbi:MULTISPECIES: 4'-phosphopantetheinyl transferase [unclassified Streptomyces]|uniref:4'-phosphopantetheinyl transferase family protein n=1 Tax=unclassified Streptomyces TaxID=2593676 RepID=UPI003822736C
MIEALLPGAATSEVFGPDGSAALYPEEAAVVARAVDRRREEFATVRACARRALAALGMPPVPVLPGVRNVPQWPAGVVGSMTHCEGYRAAALARDTDLAMIGIDAEPDLPLPGGVLESIALPGELAWARGGGAVPRFSRDRLLFSAKEAVYKTWYPLMGTELDFDDADIAFQEDGAAARPQGTFSARILRPRRAPDGRLVERFAGSWLADRGLVVTAIGFPAALGAAKPETRAGTVGYQGP